MRAPRFVVVAGPTASGKSALGLDLAGRFGGEIVNADSRQVFRGLDVGTAKPTPEERRAVPHHLYDVVDPDEPFDTARYRDLARPCVLAIAARGRLPVVVGGTGLYLRTLCRGLFAGPAADPSLRSVLERIERARRGTLWRWCERLDPAAAARLHANDTVRLARALEVALRTGERLSAFQERHAFAEPLGETLFLVLDPPREALDRRIAERSRRMFTELGLLDEVRALRERGYGGDLRPMRAIGYREAAKVLDGEWTLEEGIAELVRSTRRFARRQRTWFRSEPGTIVLDPDREPERARALVEAHRAGEPLPPVHSG